MNIILFTGLTPTPENKNGPSAMMFHLFKNRPKDYNLRIYSLNHNNINAEERYSNACILNAEILIIRDSFYNYIHRRHTFCETRILLHIDKSYGESNYRLGYKYLKEFEDFKPDIVWLYNEVFVTVARQLSNYNLVVCGYDCLPLHYNRLLKDLYSFSFNENLYKKFLFQYKVSIFRELEYKIFPVKKYFVGINDCKYYETITRISDAQFFPHPHYNLVDKSIYFKDKTILKVILSGKLDEYTYSESIKLMESLINESVKLHEKFNITFLGKGWDEIAKKVKLAGYTVQHKLWVDNYVDELTNYDIQIFPISVGSGTKGKVLDALSTGLLVIGSAIALENIYVKNNHSCIQYDNAEDICAILEKVYINRSIFQQIAENGRAQVRKWHNPERILSLIIDKFNNNSLYDGFKEYNSIFLKLTSIVK
ncbi:MAG: glycosyltransferase [Bacteroidia bacterium]